MRERGMGPDATAMNSHIIAIVDDDALVRDGVQRLVNSMNFRTEQFPSPDRLFAFKDLQQVRCIICDVYGSGESTENLPDLLKSLGYEIPVIFMTALPSAAMRARLLGAGAIGVLAKPFHQSDMARSLRAALEGIRVPGNSC
jgi:FixJ family two-component response regulator